MQTVILVLEAVSERVGRLAAWSTALMVGLIFFLVVMRYGFGSFDQRLSELTTILLGFVLLLLQGLALALRAVVTLRRR